MRNRTFYFFTALGLLSLIVSGCVFYPKAVENEKPKCELVTKQLTLDVYTMESNDAYHLSNDLNRANRANCKEPECLLLASPIIAVSAGSAIVSGSIVVIGNTLHWIEENGRCKDGVIRKAVGQLTDAASAAGGWIVETADDLIDWFWGQSPESN